MNESAQDAAPELLPPAAAEPEAAPQTEATHKERAWALLHANRAKGLPDAHVPGQENAGGGQLLEVDPAEVSQ